MRQFEVLVIVFKKALMLSVMIAFSILAACGDPDTKPHQPTQVQASSTPTPPPPEVTPPNPKPNSPLLSYAGCKVEMTNQVPSTRQTEDIFELFDITLVISAQGNYQLNVDGQYCFNYLRPVACGLRRKYIESSWASDGTNVILYNLQEKVLGIVTQSTTESKAKARLQVTDSELKDLGVPDVIFLNVTPCTQKGSAATGKH